MLEEMYPEVLRGSTPNTDTTFRMVDYPVEVLGSSAVAASCALTAVDEILATISIPAGVLGANSILRIEPFWSFPSSANNKILKVKINGTTVYNVTRGTGVTREAPLVVIANRNSLVSQIQPYDNTYLVAGTGTATPYTIDTSAANTITICAQRALGSEAVKLEYYAVMHLVGA